MTTPADGLYHVLGVAPGATDEEVRHAYHRLVQLHHPDHNGGSPESARRFAEVQDAYTRILALRRGGAAREAAAAAAAATAARGAGGAAAADDLDARIAAMERELREAREAAAKARVAAARAAASQATEGSAESGEGADRPGRRRATPEELGYVTTDDTFSAILDDAGEELGRHWGRSKGRSFVERLTDLLHDGSDGQAGE